MRIVGLDVSKASVSCCLLTEKPAEPRQFYYDCSFLQLQANASGITELLRLEPDAAVMEPTGVNYSRLWGTHLARAGIPVYLVGHRQLRAYRRDHLELPDKDDDADSLALACYWFDYHQADSRFVQLREQPIVRIRELVLRLAHLNRVQSPIINRARQDLAWQFPEAALMQSQRGRGKNAGQPPLLWGWLCGKRRSAKYDRMLAQTVGSGIQQPLRNHARRLCDLQEEEMVIESELHQLITRPEFNPYRKVFTRFGMGMRVQALLISQIYPIENYLDRETGKPIVIIRRGRESKKPTKRHLSLRRFQKALGMAPSSESSGDKESKKVVGGSDLCRKALWQWAFTRIEPKRTRCKTPFGQELGDILDLEKAKNTPIKLARSRTIAKAVKLLFKELVREIAKI